ncbi:hypothetical protein HY793_03685 [Candidatus Desantisbacteria bacterium]|nr:hypothetical protein [Candidatus Desantisbacteria bacterium]
MLKLILNFIFFRRFRLNKRLNKLIEEQRSEWTEEILEALFKGMSLMLCVDKDFSRNIKNFNARYLFKSMDAEITVAAIFKNNKMKVREKEIADTNITIIFKDHRVLMNFLLSPRQDILQSILKQEISYKGNLNYLSKFAYMSKSLQLMAEGKK